MVNSGEGFLDMQQDIITSVKTFFPDLDKNIQTSFYENFTHTYGQEQYFDYIFGDQSIAIWNMFGKFSNPEPIRQVNTFFYSFKDQQNMI